MIISEKDRDSNYASLPAKQGDDLSLYVNTSLVDIVADRIRTNIYTGYYMPGKKLIVRALSEEFGVSHTPVKDALNRLIAEGYIEALPRRSMVVRSFTNGDLIESLQVRLMCEIFSAGEIIEGARNNPQIIEELCAVLQAMHQLLSEKENLKYECWVNEETKFHRCYMQLCGNAKMFELYKGLDTNKTTYFAYLGSSHMPLKFSTLESNCLDHEAILAAIVAFDAPRLINAVIRHLSRACEDYATDEIALEKIARLKRVCKKFET